MSVQQLVISASHKDQNEAGKSCLFCTQVAEKQKIYTVACSSVLVISGLDTLYIGLHAKLG